jgi:tetratricopeptide (TPR) repeat protein
MSLVCNFLQRQASNKWLIVLDNADDADVLTAGQFSLAKLVRDLRPGSMLKFGSMLITTRDRSVAQILGGKAQDSIHVPQLSPENALKLLQRKLPDDMKIDTEIGFRVLSILEYLPLCITQAAAYIDQCEIDLAQYHDELVDSDLSLIHSLEQEWPDLRRGFDTPNSVLKAWKLSFDKIHLRYQQASRLLSVMGFLDRQAIYRDLLMGAVDTPAHLNQALGTLRGFCLIVAETGKDSYRMHRLVQLAIRFWLSHRGTESEELAFKLVARNFCQDSGDVIRQRGLISHAKVVETYTFSTPDLKLDHAQLQYCMALYAHTSGHYNTAAGYCEKACEQRTQILGPCDPATLQARSFAGMITRYQGKFDRACSLQRDVLKLREEVLGMDDLQTIESVSALADVLERNGRFEEALSFAKRAANVRKRQLGEADPETLHSLMLLALLCRRRTKYDRAETLYRQILDVYEKTLSKDHESTLDCADALSSLLRERGRYDEALALSIGVADERDSKLGQEHPRTLIAKNNTALSYRRCQRFKEAESIFRDLCSTYQGCDREGDPDALQMFSNHSVVLRNLKKYEESATMARRAL